MSKIRVLTKSPSVTNQFRRYVSAPEKPKDITANVKGLSNKVIIANPPPERVKKTLDNTYKNPQYFSYHKTSYFDAEIEMLNYRLPQPSSLKSTVLYRLVSRYVPMITFPIAFVAGIVGYNIERKVHKMETPSIPSVLEAKLNRKNETPRNNSYESIPVLERNLPPPLK